MGYLVIDEKELELKKNEIQLTAQDVSEILEYKQIFIKFLNKAIHAVQTQLGSCLLKGKENEGYSAIDTIIKLIKDIEELQNTYNKYLQEEDKKKPIK